MGGKWHRTKEQEEYLDSMLPGYLEALDAKKTAAFALVVAEGWFHRWPEGDVLFNQPGPDDPPLTEDEKAQRKSVIAAAVEKRRQASKAFIDISKKEAYKFLQRISSYLQWHVDKIRVSGGRVSRAKADILPKMLKMASKHRRKQPAQVFAQLFKHKIDEKLLQELPTLLKDPSPDEIKAHKTLKLRTRNKITYRLWEEADEETREAVFTHKAQLDREAGFISGDDESREGREETDTAGQISRAEMQKNINALGKTVVTVAKELARKTGWSITVLMGGLNELGNPDVASVNVGVTPMTGLNFAEYVVDFDSRILQPFRDFLSVVYPLELRQARAAEYDMKNMNGPVTPVSELRKTQGSDAVSTETTSDDLNLVEVESTMTLVNESVAPASGLPGSGTMSIETANADPTAKEMLVTWDAGEMVDGSSTAVSEVFRMQGSHTVSTETTKGDLNVTETVSAALPLPPLMLPGPMTQLSNQAAEASSLSTTGAEASMDASGFNWEEFVFGPQIFDPSLFDFNSSLPNTFTDLGSFGTAGGANLQQQSTSNCIDNTFLDMMAPYGLGSAYQPANHAVVLDEMATFLSGPGPISASGNTSQLNPLVVPGAQGNPYQSCGNMMVSTAPALAPGLPQARQDPTTTSEQAHSTTRADDMVQLTGDCPFTTEPFSDAAGVLNMDPHPGEIEPDTNKVAVRKAKKPRKNGSATSTTKSDISSLGKVVRAEADGEQIAPNVSASGRPSRNRKRKEPMGAAYEQEVERLESKKKKV